MAGLTVRRPSKSAAASAVFRPIQSRWRTYLQLDCWGVAQLVKPADSYYVGRNSKPARDFGHVDALTRILSSQVARCGGVPSIGSLSIYHCEVKIKPHLEVGTTAVSWTFWASHVVPTLWCRRRRARTFHYGGPCSSAPTTTKAFRVPSHIGAQWPTTARPPRQLCRGLIAPRMHKCTAGLWATTSSASTGRVRKMPVVADDHRPAMGIQSIDRGCHLR